MAAVRAVLFDYGDTLGDLSVDEARILEAYGDVRSMLQAQVGGRCPRGRELVQNVTVRVIGLVNASYARRELEELDALTLFEEAFAELGLEVPRDTVQEIAGIEYRAMVATRTVPPANLEALQALRARGLKLGLVSNAHFLPALMLEDFERLGLAERMDAIVTSSQIGVRKAPPGDLRADADGAGGRAVRDRVRRRQGPGGHRRTRSSSGCEPSLTHQFRQEEPDSESGPDVTIQSLSELVDRRGRIRHDTHVSAWL